MSADTLRRAAALMRERAEGATPSDMWIRGRDQRPHERPDSLHINHRPHVFAVVHGGPIENRDHIASWHPTVALAVADCIDAALCYFDPDEFSEAEREMHDSLLTLARTYLNESE